MSERVAPCRYLLLDPLNTETVKPDQRDRESVPQLLLELLKDLLRRDYQNPLTATAADQLGEDEPDLQGLAETDHVRDQDPRTEVFQRQFYGALLVGEGVEQEAVGERDALLGLRKRSPS